MNNKSFTLIEILVVIVIVGIISAFIIVSMAGVSDKATIAKGQAFSNSLKNALMLNLVSEWRLDDASGTTIQDHWGANPGTWSGAGGGAYTSPSWRTSSECVSGGCLAFDGTDDYVDCGNGANLKPTTALTIGLWIKPNNPIGGVGYDRFITRADAAGSSANNSYSFQFYSTTGRLNFAIWIDGDTAVKNLYGNAILTAGDWYYIVGTYDGSYLRIYLNGNLDCTPMSQTGNIRAGTYNFLIGACTGLQSTTMYGGLIDDVRIYNAAIPASQIQQNYYSGLNRLLAGNGINQEEFMERISQLESSVGKN